MIDRDARNFVESQRLGFVATVSPDGRPNISPKGTLIAWDDRTLAFADIRSPDTVGNIRRNPNVEINVVDPISRRGYLFQGTATEAKGEELESVMSRYKEIGIRSEISSVVLVRVKSVSHVTSPLYDLGMSEDEIRSVWKARLGL